MAGDRGGAGRLVGCVPRLADEHESGRDEGGREGVGSGVLIFE